MTLTVIANCRLLEPRIGEFLEPRFLAIEDGRVCEISDRPIKLGAEVQIDAGGRRVLPGLIDAHFHAYGADFDVRKLDATPRSLLAQYARRSLEDAVQRGFTSIRDAAGADIGLKLAIDRGLIAGPRLYISGLAISQTGGHGDPRPQEEQSAEQGCLCSRSGVLTCIADGPEAVRRVAREQLRQGADQIKIFASGGVISPTDPIWMVQLTASEIRAAVDEAASRRTYVMAHAHTSEAVRHCLENGVRSIEHATLLDRKTASLIAQRGAFAVPTLIVLQLLAEEGARLGLGPAQLGKAAELNEHARRSLELLCEAGAKIGFGTDLLGPLMERQAREFQLRREVMSAAAVLRSATIVNAELLGEAGRLGELIPGAHADLLMVDGDPLADLGVLSDPARIQLVMKGGVIMRNILS